MRLTEQGAGHLPLAGPDCWPLGLEGVGSWLALPCLMSSWLTFLPQGLQDVLGLGWGEEFEGIEKSPGTREGRLGSAAPEAPCSLCSGSPYPFLTTLGMAGPSLRPLPPVRLWPWIQASNPESYVLVELWVN